MVSIAEMLNGKYNNDVIQVKVVNAEEPKIVNNKKLQCLTVSDGTADVKWDVWYPKTTFTLGMMIEITGTWINTKGDYGPKLSLRRADGNYKVLSMDEKNIPNIPNSQDQPQISQNIVNNQPQIAPQRKQELDNIVNYPYKDSFHVLDTIALQTELENAVRGGAAQSYIVGLNIAILLKRGNSPTVDSNTDYIQL